MLTCLIILLVLFLLGLTACKLFKLAWWILVWVVAISTFTWPILIWYLWHKKKMENTYYIYHK